MQRCETLPTLWKTTVAHPQVGILLTFCWTLHPKPPTGSPALVCLDSVGFLRINSPMPPRRHADP